MRLRSWLLCLSTVSLLACGAPARPHEPAASVAPAGPASAHETLEYPAGAATMEGYLAVPSNTTGKRPGVLVFHDWMGLGANTKMRADKLAELGYVALAADLYGKGVRPTNPGEAGKLAGQYKEDRETLRLRGKAALDRLVATGKVDPNSIAVIGYCFGGTAALELARSGAPLAGTVSFHGGLSTPHPEDAKNIHGKVLVLHGADDPFVKPEEVAAFETEMRTAKIDWQLVAYGGAVHAFTVEGAGNDPSKGAAYDAKADKRSWDEMRRFFVELWGR